MDRSKSVAKRPTKVKVPQLPGDFIPLGSKPDSKLSSGSQSRKTLPSGVSLPLKRDSPSLPGLGLTSKKPKLSQTFTPLGRPSDAERRGSPTVQTYLYEELAKEVEPADLLSAINDAEDSNDDEKIEALLCGAVKYLKMNRAKPDPAIYLGLMYLARSRPSFFGSEVVIEAFCSLLKRDVSMNFKAKGNALVSVLTCSVMMAAFQDEENWPDSFVKILLEDSLGERVWVDRSDCKMFIQNVQSAFNTKFQSTLNSDTRLDQPISAGASPSQTSSFGEDEDRSIDSTTDNGSSRPSSSLSEDISSFVFPRYTYQQVSIETNVLDLLRDHLTRRQPMDGGSRNLLRVMSVACGYSEVRTMAAQRLEMWLQNPKLTRPAQDLLMAVCMNCDQHSQQDVEVMSQISKIRLKTKVLINHHLFCIRELLSQHSDNLKTLMMHAIYNELSNSRNPNNMSLLSTMFNHSPELSARVLADIFQDLLCNRDDYLRAVRALVREIVKAARHDFNFNEFALGLMEERDFHSLEPPLKDRMFLSLTDLITLTELLCITPSVREAFTAMARGCHKDTEQLRTFQKQIATIQRDAIWWLHTVVPKMFDCKSADYIHCLKKALFMEKPEYYYKMDNWPPEVDRGLMLRLVCEVPVYENTLMRVLLMGLTRELQVNAADSLELADQLVRRAAPLYSEGLKVGKIGKRSHFPVLQVEKLELIDAVLNLCSYHHPENIVLPKGYEPPTLAISNLYWKAWTMLLIISAFNPATFGLTAWDSYPTLKCLMEMMMTNNYKFPPPTMGTTEQTVEEIKSKEKQVSRLERQRILEFEGHLAAGTSKVQITEANSLLLPQLITMDPSGIARRPPGVVLEQLKQLNQTLNIGSMLCRSRKPDFLLDVIRRQGTSQAMPWLAELVESSESSLDVLPVQCLCEFLLHDVPVEGSSSPLEDDDESKAEKYKRKQKQRKQQQLLGRLRSLLHDTASGTHTISEVLTHFLKRLSSTHSSTRQLAVKGLSMVLSKSQSDHDSSDMEVDFDEVSSDHLTSGHAWLLEQLPSLPGFDGVCTQVYHSLRRACQIETDAVAVGAYVIFLSQHTDKLQMQEMDELAADMAQLIVDRTTLVNHLLQRHHPDSDRAHAVLAGLLRLFMNYLSSAQQPHGEAYSWSNTQDQILLQWETGESATINILVVHAMIILLTYGQPQGESDFERMLETWFPQGGHPPSAFLVDTSEEALLLPDWLKLRMIRCTTERLVDAAMQDLESSQLLLFIQSFGIPTASMGKLLRYLDRSVTVDSGAIQQLVVDKDYMIQLIDIQHMRGATGGMQFRALLQQHTQTPSTKDVDMEVPAPTTRRRTLSQLCRTPALPQIENGNIEQVKSQLLKMFPASDSTDALTATEKQQIFRSLQKGMLKEDVARTVLKALEELLSHDVTASSWHAALRRHTHLGCALTRSVVALHQTASLRTTAKHVMQLITTGGSNSNSPLDRLVRDFLRQQSCGGSGDADVVPPGEEGAIVINEKTSIEQIIATLGSCDQLEQHLVASITKGMREGRNKEMTQFVCSELTRLHKSSLPISLAGLLVDWLELLDPEVIALCPDIEQQLLFAQRESVNTSVTSGDRSSGVCVSERQHGFNQSYLLALVTHQCNWSTIRRCVALLVDGTHDTHRFNPASVLDFLSACMHIPALWQGRDKKLPKNYMMEDVLRLRPNQTPQVIKYIIAEATVANTDHQLAPEERALQRVPLLLQCCNGKRQLVLPVIKYLVEGSSTTGRHARGGLQQSVCASLLHDLYLHLPNVVTLTRDSQWTATDVKTKQNSSSQLDVICHQLLSALGNAGHGKTAENRMYDANIACRQLASHHPTLLLRQLPMLAALLQGRAQFTFNELRHRNHILLYTHLLGILELVQPALFHPDYSAPFGQTIHAYCQLIHIHGLRNKQLASIVTKFIKLLHSFLSHDPALASRILHPHVPLLNELIYLYPDFPVLRSLLAGLTLPRQERSEVLDPTPSLEDVNALPAVVLPRPSSPWSASELAPFLQKIAPGSPLDEVLEVLRDLDETSKRKVDILQHFLDELRRLVTSSNDLCCSLAHTLMMRHIRHNPRCASEFVSVFVRCLESANQDIVNTALKNLAEFVLFAQADASLLLQKTFTVGIVSKVNTSSFICDALQLLNTETLV